MKRVKGSTHLTIELAEIVFSISSSDCFIDRLEWGENYQNFFSKKEGEVFIHTHYNEIPTFEFTKNDLVFHSGKIWSLYRWQGKYIFSLKSPTLGPAPYRVAVFESNFCRGEIYSQVFEYQGSTSNLSLPNPLEYPLSDVLMVCLLSQGYGLMLHACGVEDDALGYLFLGNSTHGKSTIAKLWFENQGTVLNDDRIIVREKDSEFWMYGTPWHGDYPEVSPQGLPIHKIFFLHHGK